MDETQALSRLKSGENIDFTKMNWRILRNSRTRVMVSGSLWLD